MADLDRQRRALRRHRAAGPVVGLAGRRQMGSPGSQWRRLKSSSLLGIAFPGIFPASVTRSRVGQRTASASLFRSRPCGFVNRKMFSFRSNPALFMA
jgi:hypothetical protein